MFTYRTISMLMASDSCKTIDQSALRMIDDVIILTNEEQLKLDQPSWKLWSQLWEHLRS